MIYFHIICLAFMFFLFAATISSIPTSLLVFGGIAIIIVSCIAMWILIELGEL